MPAPPALPYDDAPAAHARTPPTPDHRHAGLAPQRGPPPRRTGPWAAATPQERLVVLKHPDGTREPLAIGVPGDREVDQKRLEGQLEPIEVEAMDEARWRGTPPGQGLQSVPMVLGEESKSASATSSTARSWGHPLGHRRQRAGLPRPRLVVGRDFTPDGTIEAADVRDGTPAAGARSGATTVSSSPPAVSRWAHLPARRKYADALGLKVLDENGKP